ncbi:hypothetical protein L873DRAFT_1187070 [Choiromyces venosus 120613-1]|uniref:Uncharacterized protein n=1 Tax=Choiromyces venosus 120613-1 TaxID=1336337 RepID=A0A3N4K6F3_9PEZI|nr:hypothetical protein L873DRAFT_1186925 [Choiromyces venosus 120613-1]RPB04951.1 hypothetical protein L873DRAFT_1187070 [Choiromyces venosus 120613-1]
MISRPHSPSPPTHYLTTLSPPASPLLSQCSSSPSAPPTRLALLGRPRSSASRVSIIYSTLCSSQSYSSFKTSTQSHGWRSLSTKNLSANAYSSKSVCFFSFL